MWLAGIHNLLVRSEGLDKGEREEISEGLTALLRSLLSRRLGASVAGAGGGAG